MLLKGSETVVVNEDIQIMVTEVSGRLVKIDVNAPRHVFIHQTELLAWKTDLPGDDERELELPEKRPR